MVKEILVSRNALRIFCIYSYSYINIFQVRNINSYTF